MKNTAARILCPSAPPSPPSKGALAQLALAAAWHGCGEDFLWLLVRAPAGRTVPGTKPAEASAPPQALELARLVDLVSGEHPPLAGALAWLLASVAEAREAVAKLCTLMDAAQSWEEELGALGAAICDQELETLLSDSSWNDPRDVLPDEAKGGEGIDWRTLLRLAEARRHAGSQDRRLPRVIACLRREVGREDP